MNAGFQPQDFDAMFERILLKMLNHQLQIPSLLPFVDIDPGIQQIYLDNWVPQVLLAQGQ